MKKVIFLVLVLLGLGSGFLYQNNLQEGRILSGSETKTVAEITPTPSITPSEPVTITIPSLEIEADVEHVAEDSEGRMDVPKSVFNTAWYELGVMPGEKGNAVIAGHLDTPEGNPSVFYEIDDMDPGDEIITTDENGTEYVFEVESLETFKDSNFPIETVFGSYDRKRLNLITCAGEFDQTTQNYSDRTVVFSSFKETR